MSADILSLDVPRWSAREEINAVEMSWGEIVKTIDRLSRQVRLEAAKTYDGARRAVIYITYEEFVDTAARGTAA